MSQDTDWPFYHVTHTGKWVAADVFDAAIRERDEARAEIEAWMKLAKEAADAFITVAMQRDEAREELAKVTEQRDEWKFAYLSSVERGDLFRSQLDEARAELAAVIALAGDYQRDANELRAAIEAHNASLAGCDVPGYGITLPPSSANKGDET